MPTPLGVLPPGASIHLPVGAHTPGPVPIGTGLSSLPGDSSVLASLNLGAIGGILNPSQARQAKRIYCGNIPSNYNDVCKKGEVRGGGVEEEGEKKWRISKYLSLSLSLFLSLFSLSL